MPLSQVQGTLLPYNKAQFSVSLIKLSNRKAVGQVLPILGLMNKVLNTCETTLRFVNMFKNVFNSGYCNAYELFKHLGIGKSLD